jgi:predicted secreted protein
MMNVLAPTTEDDLHPRLQVREYARYLQDPYRDLLEEELPDNLARLIRGIDASRPRGTERKLDTAPTS